MNYKETNIDFIGAIPEHWSLVPVKYLSSFRMGQTILKEDLIDDGKFPVYSATEKDSYFGYIDNPLFTLEKGDIVIPARGNSIGHVKLVNEKSVSTQTTIANLIDQEKVSSKFLYYFYKAFKVNLFPYDNTAIPQITVEKIRENIITLPPIIEQSQIAAFLDQKTTQIDTIIEKKQKLLQLLDEKKKSVINEAVTKGLNPDVPMKDSGIEWIGDIPESWEISKLKWEVENLNNLRKPLDSVDRGNRQGTYPYYGASGVIDYIDDYIFDGNYILIAEDGANILSRSTPLAFIAKGKYWVNNHAHILDVKRNNIDFICEQLELRDYSDVVSGSAQPKLTKETIQDIDIVIPPIEEQNQIGRYLNDVKIRFSTLKSKIVFQIKKLREYRQSLISEAVTGKLKI